MLVSTLNFQTKLHVETIPVTTNSVQCSGVVCHRPPPVSTPSKPSYVSCELRVPPTLPVPSKTTEVLRPTYFHYRKSSCFSTNITNEVPGPFKTVPTPDVIHKVLLSLSRWVTPLTRWVLRSSREFTIPRLVLRLNRCEWGFIITNTKRITSIFPYL